MRDFEWIINASRQRLDLMIILSYKRSNHNSFSFYARRDCFVGRDVALKIFAEKWVYGKSGCNRRLVLGLQPPAARVPTRKCREGSLSRLYGEDFFIAPAVVQPAQTLESGVWGRLSACTVCRWKNSYSGFDRLCCTPINVKHLLSASGAAVRAWARSMVCRRGGRRVRTPV